jgi:hypothetical protein
MLRPWRSQTRAVASPLPAVATICPSGENTVQQMSSVCPRSSAKGCSRPASASWVFHRLTDLPAATAKTSSRGANAPLQTGRVLSPIVVGCAVAMSHSRVTPSSVPVRSRWPSSGENARAETGERCARTASGAPAASQTRTSPSSDAVTKQSPFGDQATLVIRCV